MRWPVLALACSFNAPVGVVPGVDDEDSRRYRGGDGGQLLVVEPPTFDPPCRPGRDARHRAPRDLLVAVGQGRGSLPALDSDVLGLVAAAGAAGVEDDLLGVRPGDEHGRAAGQLPVGSEGDARVVGAERDRAAGYREPGWYGEQDGERGEDQLRMPEEAEAKREKGRGQAQGGTGRPVAFLIAGRVWQHVFLPLTVG